MNRFLGGRLEAVGGHRVFDEACRKIVLDVILTLTSLSGVPILLAVSMSLLVRMTWTLGQVTRAS